MEFAWVSLPSLVEAQRVALGEQRGAVVNSRLWVDLEHMTGVCVDPERKVVG